MKRALVHSRGTKRGRGKKKEGQEPYIIDNRDNRSGIRYDRFRTVELIRGGEGREETRRVVKICYNRNDVL